MMPLEPVHQSSRRRKTTAQHDDQRRLAYLGTAHRAAALAVIAVTATFIFIFTGCGTGTSGPAPVQIGDHPISAASLAHWTSAEAVLSYETNPTQAPPIGLVPDPPNYTDCIAYLANAATKATAPRTNPSKAQLKRDCQLRYRLLQRHMLDILITNYWVTSEGAALHLSVSESELKQALARQFPRPAEFRRFLRLTGEREADELMILRGNLLTTKLQQHVTQGLTGTRLQQTFVKFHEQFTAKWKAQTNCRPGYVVSECEQYHGPTPG
jgi:hypothetical protein